MQIAVFGAALPEIRTKVRPGLLLLAAGGVLLSPLSWLITDGGPHFATWAVYGVGGASVAVGLLLDTLSRRRAH